MRFTRRGFLRGLLAVPVAAAIAIKTELVVFEDYAAATGLDELAIITKRYIYPTQLCDLFFEGNSPVLAYLRAQGNSNATQITYGIPTTNAFTHNQNQTEQRKIQDE